MELYHALPFDVKASNRLPFGVSTFTLEQVGVERGIAGVNGAAGALLLWDFGATSYVTVLGVGLNQAAIGPARVRDWVVAGRFLQAGDGRAAVVDKHYAAFFRLKPGDEVKIGGESFRVVGIVEVQAGNQVAAANLYILLEEAQNLARLPANAVNQIYVRVALASAVDEVVQQSRAALGEVNATTEQSIVQVMGGIALVSERFAGIASLVALLGGLLLTGLALSASVTERRREIGVMKAVGWTAAEVRRYFTVEGLMLSLLGAVVGVVLGGLVTWALGLIPIDFGSLNFSTPQGLSAAPVVSTTMTLTARLTFASIALALATAMLGGAMASWLVARRAAALKPAEAFRE